MRVVKRERECKPKHHFTLVVTTTTTIVHHHYNLNLVSLGWMSDDSVVLLLLFFSRVQFLSQWHICLAHPLFLSNHSSISSLYNLMLFAPSLSLILIDMIVNNASLNSNPDSYFLPPLQAMLDIIVLLISFTISLHNILSLPSIIYIVFKTKSSKVISFCKRILPKCINIIAHKWTKKKASRKEREYSWQANFSSFPYLTLPGILFSM